MSRLPISEYLYPIEAFNFVLNIFRMESSGRPEQVHISEVTRNFINDDYNIEDGEEVEGNIKYFICVLYNSICFYISLGQRTYFVINRRKDRHDSNKSDCPADLSNSTLTTHKKHCDGFSFSSTDVSIAHPSVSPASPIRPAVTSINRSPVNEHLHRLAPFNIVTKYLSGSMNTKETMDETSKNDPHIGNPTIVISTRSLPDSLGSDIDNNGCCRSLKPSDSELPTTKPNNKVRGWKVPNFLRNIDDSYADSRDKSIKSTKNYRTKPEDLPCIVAVDYHHTGSGYCPLPIVIETPISPGAPSHLLVVPNRVSTHCSLSSSRSPDQSGSSIGQHSMFDEIIDVRSYISQSRSDISPFSRTESYRLKSPTNCPELSPYRRPRALTVNSPVVNGNPWDVLSICQSAHSRKDSGVRSNSRRSSIQQQIYIKNQSQLSHQRVSGYFTSSQSSIGDLPDPVKIPAGPNPDPLGACLQHLRKQSDLQLIRCVRDNAKSQRSYLVKPPLSPFSLFFKSRRIEQEFRDSAHRFGFEFQSEGPPTLATPKYNTYIDITICLLVYFAISASLFLISFSTSKPIYQPWIIIFAFFTIAQLLALIIFTNHFDTVSSRTGDRSIIKWISSWYLWHVFLGMVILFPVLLIILKFLLQDIAKSAVFEYYYGFMVFVCIIHFCNFTQLNCWMRNSLAVLTAIVFVGLSVGQSGSYQSNSVNNNITDNTILFNNETNFQVGHSFRAHGIEIYLDLMLVLILVWFLNREFEIGYRLAFYGNAVAQKDKIQVQNMKNQADILLHNIIPKHVAEHLKNTAKYSENHHSVAIIFASIVNFNELYDESYLGGKEYLRVLNELIGDFDELLSRPEFRSVEKIKTIGSTFMAASGLDPHLRGKSGEHIYALMDFAVAMQNVVNDFNKDLLEFNLVLRIGLNVGDVTAGVIGTSKLHYDIWGDAVNVASRMDSTGVAGRIQVGLAGVRALEKKWMFETRGKVYVKGKDHMEVFLVKQPKET